MKCQRPGVSWNKLLCWLHYNPICKMRKTVFSCWGIKLCCEPFPLREHTLSVVCHTKKLLSLQQLQPAKLILLVLERGICAYRLWHPIYM